MLVFLGAWELYARSGAVDDLILPAPTQIADALGRRPRAAVGQLPRHRQRGRGSASLAALVARVRARGDAALQPHRPPRASTRCSSGPRRCRSSSSRRCCVVWFGFGLAPKLVIIALVCFFPIVVDDARRAAQRRPRQLKLLRTLDATRWQAFRFAEAARRRCRRRSAARRSPSPSSVIGAVFAEYAGSERGPRPPHPAGDPAARRPPARTPRSSSSPRSPSSSSTCSPPPSALVPEPPDRKVRPRDTAPHRARRSRAARRAHARRLRRAQGADGPAAAPKQRLTSCSTTCPTPTTPASTRRRARGSFQRAGLDVDLQTPSDPASAQAPGGGPRRPRDLLRARAAARPREGRQGHGRRRARQNRPLTSLMSVGKDAITDPKQLRGKRVGTAGIPYQTAYLDTILKEAARPEDDGEAGQRRLQPRPLDALGQGRRDARRVLEHRGRGARAPQPQARDPAPRGPRRPDLRRARHRRPRGDRPATTGP